MQDPVEDAPIQENVPEAPSEEKIETQKKRGRPAGSKDRVPRKKKVIVEEPITPIETPIETPPEEPKPDATAPKRQSKPRAKREVVEVPQANGEIEEVNHREGPEHSPPSPRSAYAEASRLIFQLQHVKQNTRRSHLSDMYTKRLIAM